MEEKALKKAHSLPFWSWNDALDEQQLCDGIEWMAKNGFGGFFMHARSGLETEYLGEKWFSCIEACAEKAKEFGLQAWAYDENGWPSGIAERKLLQNRNNLRKILTASYGERDFKAAVSYDLSGAALVRLSDGEPCSNCLNLYVGVSDSSVDTLDGAVTEQFIEKTHERYDAFFKGKISDYITGFFTDEPTYSHYSDRLIGYFREVYREDLYDGLGLLFVEKEGYRAFRYKYYLACQKLFLHNYVKKIYDWCEAHGLLFTGHFVEESGIYSQMLGCAGVMPLYEHMHMPGIDYLCRRFMPVTLIKQLVSVSVQLGKEHALTEAFGMTGWDVTPRELKAIAEYQMMYGIDVICQHLLPVSETGWRKNDHPLHFSPIVPWMEQCGGTLNRYLDRISDWIEGSEERVRVAVLHPIRSAFGCYKDGGCEELFDLDGVFRDYSDLLVDRQIAYHYLDETLLEEHGSVKGCRICCGRGEYDFLILPPGLSTVGKETERLIRTYIENGGKVFIAKDKPRYLEGRPYDFSYLQSNTDLEEIEASQAYSLTYTGGKVRSVCRENGRNKVVMALNIHCGEKAVCELSVPGKKLQKLDPSGKAFYCDGTCVLEPMQSAFFLVTDGEGAREDRKETVLLSADTFTVSDSDPNCLVLDCVQYSFDGKEYSSSQPIPAMFDFLNRSRYRGKLYLKYTFRVKEIPERISLRYEKTQPASFLINGKACVLTEEKIATVKTLVGDLAPFVTTGENEIVQELEYVQSDDVYYCIYGGGKSAYTGNTLKYDTYPESLRLFGDFGVYSDEWKKTEMENVLTAERFYIGKRKTQIQDLLSDGYPFFAGRICLQTQLDLKDPNVLLKITGRTHFVRAYMNGRAVGEYLFNDALDVSQYAKVGSNTVVLELYTGCRNLFGPFHFAGAEESFQVTPYCFDFLRNREGAYLKDYRNSYSFVRCGLFEYDGQFRLPAMER